MTAINHDQHEDDQHAEDVFKVENTKCCYCEHVLDAAESVNGSKPKEGDFTICVYCGGFMRFSGIKDTVKPRKVDEDEIVNSCEEGKELLLEMKAYQLAIRIFNGKGFLGEFERNL